MSSLTSIAVNVSAAGLVALPAALAGRTLCRTYAADGEQTTAYRWLLATLAGLAGLHLWMQLLDLAGVPWNGWSVLLPLAAAGAAGALRRRGVIDAPATSLGWGDAGAAGALLLFAVLLRDACLTMADVVYHWGIKAHRNLLAGGIDYDFLRQPWNLNKHPDYPHLVPDLFVATSLLRRSWQEPALLAWSLLFALLVIAGAREALQRAEVSPFTSRAALALISLVYVYFATSAIMGGSPDLLLAGLLVMAGPILLSPPGDAGDGQLGWLAAVAVGTKSEGLPLALLLIGVQLLRRRGAGLAIRLPTLGRLLLPALLIALPWAVQVARYDLAETRVRAFDPARAEAVARGLLEGMASPLWAGFPFVLLLLPWLLWRRDLRPLAAVVAGQLGAYVLVYLTSPHDPAWQVRTSIERLLLHLVPATLLLAAIALDRRREPITKT